MSADRISLVGGTFIDGHCHPLFAGRELLGAILHECTDVNQIAAQIRSLCSRKPELNWLDLSAVVAGSSIAKTLDRNALDALVSDIPLVIHTDDHHSIVVNSKALAVAGYSDRAPLVSGGRFEVIADGKPNGWIHEYVAMSLIYEHQPKPTLDEDVAALLKAQELLLSLGIGEVQDAWIDPGMPETYIAALQRDLLRIRVDLATRIKPESWQTDLDFAVSTRSKLRTLDSDLLSANTVKLFIDGVHASGTAFLLHDSSTSSLWNNADLLEMALQADSAGFELHFHACGDAAVRTAIRAVEAVIAANPNNNRKPVIAHADQIAEDDIADLARLGITINAQPAWLDESKPDWHPFRKLLDAGVRLTFGSDWPVSSPDPRAGLAHLKAMGELNPAWRLSDEEALECYGFVAR